MLNLQSPGDETQGFLHARQALSQQTYGSCLLIESVQEISTQGSSQMEMGN